VDKILRH